MSNSRANRRRAQGPRPVPAAPVQEEATLASPEQVTIPRRSGNEVPALQAQIQALVEEIDSQADQSAQVHRQRAYVRAQLIELVQVYNSCAESLEHALMEMGRKDQAAQVRSDREEASARVEAALEIDDGDLDHDHDHVEHDHGEHDHGEAVTG